MPATPPAPTPNHPMAQARSEWTHAAPQPHSIWYRPTGGPQRRKTSPRLSVSSCAPRCRPILGDRLRLRFFWRFTFEEDKRDRYIYSCQKFVCNRLAFKDIKCICPVFSQLQRILSRLERPLSTAKVRWTDVLAGFRNAGAKPAQVDGDHLADHPRRLRRRGSDAESQLAHFLARPWSGRARRPHCRQSIHGVMPGLASGANGHFSRALEEPFGAPTSRTAMMARSVEFNITCIIGR